MSNIYDKASLVLIPSGTKEGVVFSQKPTNGDGDFTFSRPTAATRVNADGLIEKETQNLLLQSSNQNDASYNIANSLQSVTAVSNPLTGNNDAFKIVKVSGSSDPFLGQTISTSVNGCYTGSMYLWTDSGQPTNCEIFLYDGNTAEVFTKSLTITTTPTRYEFFVNFVSTDGSIRFRLDLSATTDAYLYTYGWQLEYGLAARDYIETTTAAVYGGITDNVPRLDYTGGATCPALLLEPQRTNLFTNSEYFGGTDWTIGNSSITNNATTSPSGFVDGSFLVPNTSLGVHTCGQSVGITSGTYTLSVYAKQGGYKNLLVWFDTYSGGVGVNLDDLSVFRDQNNDGYTIEDFGNGWVRIAVTITASSEAAPNFYVYSNAATPAITHAGDGTSGIYLYGAQIEAGSYATSYIPTYGTSVTFASDFCNNGGNDQVFNSEEGVLYAEISGFENDLSNRYISLSDGSISNSIRIFYYNDGGTVFFRKYVGGVQTSIATISSINQHEMTKIAIKYNSTNFDIFANGVKISTNLDSTSFPTNTLNRIDFTDGNPVGSPFYGKTKQVLYFPTALTDEELEALTQV
jgi:hypothetical protein